MGTFGRWLRARRKTPESRQGTEPPAPAAGPPPLPDPGRLPGKELIEEVVARRGFSGWVEERAQRVVKQAYESHRTDLEERARRVMSSVYEHTADDMEERAVRAMRRAIEAEAGRIQQAIEHGIAVKKREVRLSLLVLVVSSLVYLALYWFTHRPGTP